MVFAISNSVALRYVAETVLGTTPASPSLQALRFTGEDLNFNVEFTKSDEIRADRMVPDTIQVGASAEGGFDGEMSYATYDALIAAGLFSAWVTTGSTVSGATDVLINKTAGTPNVYALESGATDFTAQSWVVGQWIKVTGFVVAGTFWAQIVSILAASLVIYPSIDIVDEAAAAAITIVPLNYVRNGVTTQAFTIQKEFTDLTAPEYYNFTGSVVDEIDLELKTKSILTTAYKFICKSAAMTETQFPTASEVAANTNDVMNAVGNVAMIVFDGDAGATAFSFNNLKLNIKNNVRGQEAVGTLGFVGVVPGRMEMTGSIELYMEDSTLFDKFVAATAFGLSFMVADSAGQRYVFTMPRSKYTSMEISAGGLDEDIFVTADFEVIIDATGAYMFQVSRAAN